MVIKNKKLIVGTTEKSKESDYIATHMYTHTHKSYVITLQKKIIGKNKRTINQSKIN